jgi:hypothetical protein
MVGNQQSVAASIVLTTIQSISVVSCVTQLHHVCCTQQPLLVSYEIALSHLYAHAYKRDMHVCYADVRMKGT